MASGPALEAFLDGWAAHQARLVEVIAPLTSEQVQLRPRPEDWAIWQLASNSCGARVDWMHDVLGEGDAALRDRFHLVEHDLQHGAEIALILRANGLPTIDL
jgi:hypothetical protein